MTTIRDKRISKVTASTNRDGKNYYASDYTFKLKVITPAERQQLRIPTYDYLLP